jgi:5-methylcytosine-specific restriction enzyme A
MAWAPKRLCSHPSCGVLTDTGRCEHYERQVKRRLERKRGSASTRGYDYRWRDAGKQCLERHPLSIACQSTGRISAATVVDHIKPHKGDRILFRDRDNGQPLCKIYHEIKTARKDGQLGGGTVNPCIGESRTGYEWVIPAFNRHRRGWGGALRVLPGQKSRAGGIVAHLSQLQLPKRDFQGFPLFPL